MLFHSYVPPPPLSAFVELFWLSEGYAQPHARERLLPQGTVELIVNLRAETSQVYRGEDDRPQGFRGPLVCGPHSGFFAIDTAREMSVLGVHFRPGGAFPFFRPPAGELHDAHVPLDAMWGPAAAELHERVLAAPTPHARFRALEQVLLAQAAHPLQRHPAVAFALRQFGRGLGVRQVGEQLGLSPRRFIDAFRDEVGLTPKLFCRVQRFQQVVRLLGAGRPVEWTAVALGCGYYDQAHFIHDFRAFSGFNPTAYLARRTEHLNHVPLPD
jgi:AraC-like DNA-binding protein